MNMKRNLFLLSLFFLSSCFVGNVDDKGYRFLTVDIHEMKTLKSGYEKGNSDDFVPGQNEETCFGIIETEAFLYLMEYD